MRMRSGWVSDRSVCYLASGRLVIAGYTGWRVRDGGAEGLVAFSDLDEAVEAVEDVLENYERHGKAAAVNSWPTALQHRRRCPVSSNDWA